MELTVVITNWQRPENTIQVIESLRGQSLKPRICLWDNSFDSGLQPGSIAFYDPYIAVRSSANYKCVARWFLAAHADTEYVAILDDDLMPADTEVLSDTVAALERLDGRPVGAWGVGLQPGKRYHQCQHFGVALNGRRYELVAADTPVDIIRGRFFAVATERLSALPMRLPELDDDIAVSACLGGGTVLASLQGRFQELPTGAESIACRSAHMQKREATRREWFSRPVAAS
jgi:hypothetical protein